jgi:AraC-like DNA-binding protein
MFGINFLSILTIIAAAQGVFIAIYLIFYEKGNLKANIYLALILLGLSFLLYDNFMFASKLFEQFPNLVLFSYPFTLAYAPVLFLFIKCITRSERTKYSRDLIHFIPSILHFGYGLMTYHLHSADFKLNYLLNSISIYETGAQNSMILSLFNLAIIVQFGIYIAASIIEMNLYKTRSREVNSFVVPKNLKWIISVMVGVLLLFLFSSLNLTLYLSRIEMISGLGQVALIIVSLYIYYLSFFIVRNPEVLARQTSLKYESSSLSSIEKEEIRDLLEKCLENKKPYYNANLTISIFANTLGIQPKHLSQVINEMYHQNFYEFINFHRIQEAKALLIDEAYNHYSIFGVGLHVGFNSKSSFNSAFKKFTKTTPLNYKKGL